MQGFFVLVDAIDRAGSTDPAKIQAALKATDLKPEQLIMGYKGVKFDDKGQNILAAGADHPAAGRRELCAGLAEGNAETAPVCPTRAGDGLRAGRGPALFVSPRSDRSSCNCKPLTCPPSSFR